MKKVNETEKTINDTSHDKSKNKDSLFLYVVKKHKISLLLILFMALASTTFSWFIYNKTVDMNLRGHVKTWDISLGDGEDEEYVFKISDLYPGMDAGTDNISIVNNGELDANVSIAIKSITLFGEVQEKDKDYTVEITDEGKTFTITGYPFTLTFYLTNVNLASGGKSELSFDLTWDYENTDPACIKTDENGEEYNECDLKDTELGEKSYDFSSNPDNKDKSSLEVALRLEIAQ